MPTFAAPHIVLGLDLLGVAVFAVSGALVASRKELDLIGFGLMATLAGVGGGTLRDLLLGRAVFWIDTPAFVAVTLGVALAVYFTAHILQRRWVMILWVDAVGLAAYAVLGAHLALTSGASPLVAVLMGIMTATFGGLLRDIVAQEQPLILRREVYATCALAGAVVYVGLQAAGVALIAAAALGFAAGFALRALGIALGWSLPTYKARPGRIYDAISDHADTKTGKDDT
ncbi:MAG: trimeric intracellular cation channel family protein [Rhodospirillales bacterium]